MTTQVNSELAKLLKEKGFVCKESSSFWMNGFSYLKKDYNPITYQDKDNVATIAEVVMWLYEKHGVWINVNITRYGRFWCNIVLKEECKHSNNPFTWEFVNQLNDFTSPTQAYEAAIKHYLKRI